MLMRLLPRSPRRSGVAAFRAHSSSRARTRLASVVRPHPYPRAPGSLRRHALRPIVQETLSAGAQAVEVILRDRIGLFQRQLLRLTDRQDGPRLRILPVHPIDGLCKDADEALG